MTHRKDRQKKQPHVASASLLAYCVTLLGHLRELEAAVQLLEIAREQGYPKDLGPFDTKIVTQLSYIRSALNANRDWDREFSDDPVAAPLAMELRSIADGALMRTSDPTSGWVITKYSHDAARPPTRSFEPLMNITLRKNMRRLAKHLFRANLEKLDAEVKVLKLGLDPVRFVKPVQVRRVEQDKPPANAHPSSETTKAPEDKWAASRIRQRLIGWKPILAAIRVPFSRNNYLQIKRYNDSDEGPIRYRGPKPMVDAGALRAWWDNFENHPRLDSTARAGPARHASAEMKSMPGGFHNEARPNARGKARPARDAD